MDLTSTVDYYIRHDSRGGSVEEVVVHAAHEGARPEPRTVTASEIDFSEYFTVASDVNLKLVYLVDPRTCW